MKLTIQGSGIIRELLPGTRGSVELQLDEPRSVREILLDILAINLQLVVAVSVNSNRVELDYIPADGDTLTIIPPLAGGR